MPTDAELLATIKSGVLATLAELFADPERPNTTYDVDGQHISWTAYTRMLFDQLKGINEQLASETPFEIHSQGYT